MVAELDVWVNGRSQQGGDRQASGVFILISQSQAESQAERECFGFEERRRSSPRGKGNSHHSEKTLEDLTIISNRLMQ